jgi:hypothetical protein
MSWREGLILKNEISWCYAKRRHPVSWCNEKNGIQDGSNLLIGHSYASYATYIDSGGVQLKGLPTVLYAQQIQLLSIDPYTL